MREFVFLVYTWSLDSVVLTWLAVKMYVLLCICKLKSLCSKEKCKVIVPSKLPRKVTASFLRVGSMRKKIRGKPEVNSEHEGIEHSDKGQVLGCRPSSSSVYPIYLTGLECKCMSSPWSAKCSAVSLCQEYLRNQNLLWFNKALSYSVLWWSLDESCPAQPCLLLSR